MYVERKQDKPHPVSLPHLQSGMHILSVDDQSVKGLTQAEAIAILKRCFNDVTNVNMKLRLKKP